jgi:hypothetical protein
MEMKKVYSIIEHTEARGGLVKVEIVFDDMTKITYTGDMIRSGNLYQTALMLSDFEIVDGKVINNEEYRIQDQ